MVDPAPEDRAYCRSCGHPFGHRQVLRNLEVPYSCDKCGDKNPDGSLKNFYKRYFGWFLAAGLIALLWFDMR